MSSFTVRIELHGADAAEYELLHAKMEQHGFQRFVTGVAADGTRGKWLLPNGEYDYTSNNSAAEVRDLAKRIADSIRGGSWCLVTRSADRSWSTKKLA